MKVAKVDRNQDNLQPSRLKSSASSRLMDQLDGGGKKIIPRKKPLRCLFQGRTVDLMFIDVAQILGTDFICELVKCTGHAATCEQYPQENLFRRQFSDSKS